MTNKVLRDGTDEALSTGVATAPTVREGSVMWWPVATAPLGRKVLLMTAAGDQCLDDWDLYDEYNVPRFTHWREPEPDSVAALLDAARDAQCACSPSERESGHLVGCWMPALEAAIAKAEGR